MKVDEDSGEESGSASDSNDRRKRDIVRSSDRKKRDIVPKQFGEPDDLRYEEEPQGGDFCPNVSM